MKSVFLSAALLTGAAFAAPAAESVKLSSTQSLLHTVVRGGKTTQERIAAPTAVLPGSTLLEEITARNVTKAALKGVVVRLVVPTGTVYQALNPKAGNWKAQFSIDGGKTYANAPLKRRVMQGGKAVQVPVGPSEYNHVRWILPIMQAGETVKLGFTVQVK